MDADRIVEKAQKSARNLRAFLFMVRRCEGTAGPDGYQAMFGYPRPGRTFESFQDHPRKRFSFIGKDNVIRFSSAAGAYQFLVATWDRLQHKLQLPDFTPESQDRAAVELIRERNAYVDVCNGEWESAVRKCAPEWASLPDGPYTEQQGARTWAFVQQALMDGGVANA